MLPGTPRLASRIKPNPPTTAGALGRQSAFGLPRVRPGRRQSCGGVGGSSVNGAGNGFVTLELDVEGMLLVPGNGE